MARKRYNYELYEITGN